MLGSGPVPAVYNVRAGRRGLTVVHRMYRSAAVAVSVCLALATAAVPPRPDDDGLLDRVLDGCSPGPGAVDCVKGNVLDYLEDGGRARTGSPRSSADEDVDSRLVRAAGEYMERRVNGEDSRDARAMDNGGGESPTAMQQENGAQQQTMQQQMMQATTTTTARADMEMGMMQDKMLMPLMMMMKMKMKMLMPIMMAMVSMKATKALVLSKLAIVMVLGFMVKEFLKKTGLPALPLHLPGLPGSSSEPPSTAGPPPPMHYGPPQSSGSYDSSWEPTGYSSPSSGYGSPSSGYGSPSSGYGSSSSGYASSPSGYSSSPSGYSSSSSSGGHSSSDSGSHSLAYSSYLPSSSSSGSSAGLAASKY